MAIKAFGSAAVRVMPETARLTVRRNGLTEGECSYECNGEQTAAGLALAAALPIGSLHPYHTQVYLESRVLVYTPRGAIANCTYAGAEYEALDKPTYELIIGMEESPIEVHPNFEVIAGAPSVPVNGAIFLDPETGGISTDDATGVFDRFAPMLDATTKNPKGGIEAFLDPVVTYRQSYVTFTLPSASGFGDIDNDVPGPGFKGSLGLRTWLYVGFTYRRRGDTSSDGDRFVYEIQKEWKLSGRAGWDTDIYDS